MADTITLADLQAPSVPMAKLRLAIPVAEGIDLNRKFIEGELWNNGLFWVGPGPKPSDPSFSDVMSMIELVFVAKNVIDEILDRHVSAMLGKEPRWAWVPIEKLKKDQEIPPELQTLIDEVESALTTWWDTRQAHRLLKAMIYKMLWAKRGVYRLYVPSGRAETNGAVSAKTLAEALDKLYLDIPEPEDSGVWEDPVTKTRVGIVIWKTPDGKEHAEVTYVDPITKQTVINLMPPEAGAVNTASNDFAGVMPIFAAELDTVWVTPQMRSLNMALNMTLTMLAKGFVDNAFLERLFMNALPPGKWEFEKDPDPVTGQPVRKAYVPDKYVTGGRQTSYIQGIDYSERQPDGSLKTIVKDPTVTFRDPTDPSGIIAGVDSWYALLIGEARQDHILIAGDSTPSGKSREQARGDFIDSTKDTETQTEAAGRSLLLALVAMGETFANMPGRYTTKLKPQFKCRTSFGPLSVEERAQNVAEAKDGFMADETAMALNGVDDVDAESALIQLQSRSTLSISEAQATVVDLWVTAGFARETGLHLAGFDDDEIAEIMQREAESAPTVDPLLLDPNAPNPGDPPLPNAPPKPTLVPPKPPAKPIPPPKAANAR